MVSKLFDCLVHLNFDSPDFYVRTLGIDTFPLIGMKLCQRELHHQHTVQK